ncbi:alpha-ketoacid dehydrogenase subunit beta [archaeon]|jgi:pyruvate dehydrogenase E1 component beta subunit|nr:alpha-ketoacid dehydrogenase subunit beta [archaeon]MDP6547981.1 alpha-ketoacid dehydrogenase subunit beta [Candidatus Woesearchaeota archaeon]|tara:strand:- start:63131 stop:64096 length:966 start_codon:yes stop_codon:yes gene_type:complete
MARMNVVEAINSALDNELKKDKRVIVLGEDVGVNGGVFRVTDGLQKKHGSDRVVDTPLAELGIVGASIGLAVNGMRPVAEIQFSGFMYAPFDQLFTHAARIRGRSRGRFTVPMVVRTPYGGGIRALELHCESGESFFAHATGMKVVIPSRPYDAKGLLISAIRDPDPVIFMEPMRVYRAIKEEVPETEYTVPLGKANIEHEGSDLTVISYGAMLKYTKQALEKSDYSAEIIDLRTIVPLDTETIINSVKKTGRCVIVHEAPKTCGFAAEIIARINEKCFFNLEAPVERVTGFDVAFPLAKSENHYLPSEKRILKAVDKVMK